MINRQSRGCLRQLLFINKYFFWLSSAVEQMALKDQYTYGCQKNDRQSERECHRFQWVAACVFRGLICQYADIQPDNDCEKDKKVDHLLNGSLLAVNKIAITSIGFGAIR